MKHFFIVVFPLHLGCAVAEALAINTSLFSEVPRPNQWLITQIRKMASSCVDVEYVGIGNYRNELLF